MGKNPDAKKNKKSKFKEKEFTYNLDVLQEEAAKRDVDISKIEKILRRENGEEVSTDSEVEYIDSSEEETESTKLQEVQEEEEEKKVEPKKGVGFAGEEAQGEQEKPKKKKKGVGFAT